MRKLVLFLVGVFCLASTDLVGQNRFNHLVINQLFGQVKEVTTTRIVYGKDEGYKNEKVTTYFNLDGYITQSGKDIYKYNETYNQCTSHISPGADYEERCWLNKKELNNECRYDTRYAQKMDGVWNKNDSETNGIIFKFDDLNRLLSHQQDDYTGKNIFKLLSDECFTRTYSYRGTEKLPYKVAEELDCGGDGWLYDLSIKYVNIDSKGNWTHRKLFKTVDNKLLMEEIRSINYYPDTNSPSSTQSTSQGTKSPSFPGGNAAMVKFFADNANPQLPAIATAGYGEIIVEFTVTESGAIENADLKGKVLVSLDNEALRLVRMMPKWNPGLIDGQPSKMRVQVGIRFLPNRAFRYIKAMLY